MSGTLNQPIDPERFQLPTPDELADDAVLQRLAAIPPGSLVRRVDARRLFGVSKDTWDAWSTSGLVPRGGEVMGPRRGDVHGASAMFYPVEMLVRLRVAIRRRKQAYIDPHDPGIWRVPLASWRQNREAIVDAADAELVRGKQWNWASRGKSGPGYVVRSGVGLTQTPLVRMIMGLAEGDPGRVGHHNGDPLDCRRANLFVRDHARQSYGCRKMGLRAGVAYTSMYKGVSWHLQRERWQARINRDGQHYHLGLFDTEEDAARAYDRAARDLFGEHAALNFPGPGEASALKLAA